MRLPRRSNYVADVNRATYEGHVWPVNATVVLSFTSTNPTVMFYSKLEPYGDKYFAKLTAYAEHVREAITMFAVLRPKLFAIDEHVGECIGRIIETLGGLDIRPAKPGDHGNHGLQTEVYLSFACNPAIGFTLNYVEVTHRRHIASWMPRP